MKLRTSNFAPVDKQRKLLERTFKVNLKEVHWMNPNGTLKKAVMYKTRNMRVDNMAYTISPLPENPDVLVVAFDFDVRFKTDKEEAVKHFSQRWCLYAEAKYNACTCNVCFQALIDQIKKQLIFTDKIDMNLYSYNELDKKGWTIIKSRKK